MLLSVRLTPRGTSLCHAAQLNVAHRGAGNGAQVSTSERVEKANMLCKILIISILEGWLSGRKHRS